MRYFPTFTILVVGIATAASAADNQPPGDLQLARRVVKAYGGVAEMEDKSMQAMQAMQPFAASSEIFMQAYRKALDAHRQDIAQADEEMAMIYARTYTEEDLKASLDFAESPLGKSIAEKEITAALKSFADGHLIPVTKALLTPEETAARKQFNDGPGTAMRARTLQATLAAMVAIGPIQTKIAREAIDNFCNSGGDCSKLHLEKLAPPPPSKP